MVTAATSSSAQLSTKALAAAGQFRAIALWLNQPLIPQGVYIQVQQDKRPGCLRITAEFDRPPEPQHLTRYICHLIWQLNSRLIEGIHLVARPVGQSAVSWERRVRVMTPALKARLQAQSGAQQGSPMPPAIARRRAQILREPLFSGKIKTLRAFMLTGSAVAAFVFGCLAEVVLVPRSGPTLPLQQRQTSQGESGKQLQAWPETPQKTVDIHAELLLTTHDAPVASRSEAATLAYRPLSAQALPSIVNGALEPVRVIQHERLNPMEDTVTLVFGGDVELDDLPYGEETVEEQFLTQIAAYQAADVAMVNLDDSLATAATSLTEEFLDRQRSDVATTLKHSGVDIVNLASDEVLAFGEQGLGETLETLDRSGLYRVGAGRTEREARRPEVLDVKGQRIAYLSYSQAKDYSAHKVSAGVNAPEKQAIMADIQAIRDEVDWLVVNYRWQQDIPEQPSDSQTNLARLAIDQGADLVVGHHPSQLQGAELYKGRPIVYSLGDFVFGAPMEDTTPESAVLQVALRDRQMKVDVIPIKVNAGQPYPAEGVEAAKILTKLDAASQDFETPMGASVVVDARPQTPATAVPRGMDRTLPAARRRLPPETVPDTGLDEGNDRRLPLSGDAVTPIHSEPIAPAPIAPANETAETELNDLEVDGWETDSLEVENHGPETGVPFYTAPNTPILTAPAEIEDRENTLDIEVEAIPDGLLDNWGPKEGAGTLYTPPAASVDSRPAAPASAPVPDPELIPQAAPSPLPPAPDVSRQPATAPEAGMSAPLGSSPHAAPPPPQAAPEKALPTSESDAISPHSEPLVGPLSSLPTPVVPKMPIDKGVTPSAGNLKSPLIEHLSGHPETRVLEPLNASTPSETAAATTAALPLESPPAPEAAGP